MEIDIKELSDEEILQFSVSDPSLFEELVNRYQEPFLRKARSIVGNREEVNDIVQDTFTKMYINAGKFKGGEGSNFRAWGYKILCNTSFTYYQKLKKDNENVYCLDTEILENTLIGDDREKIEKSYFEKELVVLISQLPRNLSRVLRLHYLEGLPQKEIADLEGVSISAVKTRVHRAKKALKKVAVDSNFIEGVYEK